MLINGMVDFERIINKMKEKIKYYEITLEANQYYLGLANGDNINLTFPKNNIAHLLGIYTDKLKNTNIVKNSLSSYEIIKKLVEYSLTYTDIKNINSGFDINSLFSEYVESKIEIFTDILKVRTDDIYCIIKYCSDRTYTTGEERENSDYFIIRKYDKKYSVLGIVKNDNRNNYVPVTSRLFNNYEELSEFLRKIAKNQEITYPASFRIDNYDKEFSKNFFPTLDEKLEYNKTLKDIASKYKAIPSTNRDILFILEKSLNSRQRTSNYSSILSLIKESIMAGNIISKEEVNQLLDDAEIPKELETLIDSCNDLICFNSQENDSVEISYSTIQNENKRLKEQLEEMKKELLELKKKNESLEIENSVLKESEKIKTKKLEILKNAFEETEKL